MKNVMNLFHMEGKVVAVTGAAGNLGTHFAEGLAQAGATLAVLDIPGSEERLKELARYLSATYSVPVMRGSIQIEQEASVRDACEAVIAEFGHVDGLLNAAGINQHGAVADYTEQDLNRLMSVNVSGIYACCKYFGGVMCRQGSGSIVNISSMSGFVINMPPTEMPGYCISKAAVHQLTRAIAAEYAQSNVRVNSISPGFMQKGMSNIKNASKVENPQEFMYELWNSIPMHRSAQADELVGAAVYLLSDASSYTTGIDILIDGGYTLW